ncbi:MAG: type III toxin-antitoxin system ToxN/AbiQ family toxin [Lachnospiraceae bacterium]|nr:type III toxin-antitoxin system ToxN/AbiQ family toxin [Lachnospiraceae bacterium]
MCQQELKWCQENSETVCNKANVLYRKYMSGEEFSGRKRCLNFHKLETECRKYNSKQQNYKNGR